MSYDPELYRMMARQPTVLQAVEASLGITPPSEPVVIDARAGREPLASRCQRRIRAALRFARTVSVAVCAGVITGVILTWLAIR